MMTILTACGKESSKKENESESPSDSLTSLFEHASNNEYSNMEQYISTNILNAMESNGYGMNAYAADITDNGSIESIEVLSEEIKGEGATIKYKEIYTDGSEKDNIVSLTKEDKNWKVSPQ
ncbi:hypothetical protein ACWCQ1_51565 [Streptomyces sp. NPDC002144]